MRVAAGVALAGAAAGVILLRRHGAPAAVREPAALVLAEAEATLAPALAAAPCA
jgi:hypothetical protein